MKKKDFLWVFLLLFPVTVNSQKGPVRSDLSVQSAGLSKGFSSIELCYDVIGYNFTDRLYANLRYEHSTTLFKEDGTKTYARNHTEGINVGYDFEQKEDYRIGLQAGIGTSAWWKSTDWKFNCYDATVYVEFGSCKVKPRMNLGVKFYDSRDSQHKNRWTILTGIGFRI